MAQTTITFRTDAETKKDFDEFCSEVGMNASVAFNIFMRATVNAGELPFRVRSPRRINDDKYFSGENLKRIERSVAQADAGQLTEHELSRISND